jgi:hypothetical protein
LVFGNKNGSKNTASKQTENDTGSALVWFFDLNQTNDIEFRKKQNNSINFFCLTLFAQLSVFICCKLPFYCEENGRNP